MIANVSSESARLPTVGPVYLTFDDGPDPRWTPHILDILDQANVLATFFVVGRLALEQPAIMRRIVTQGHEVGNHSWSHRHPWTLSSEAARLEVRDGASTIADLIGHAPRFFRPPHGRVRRCMVDEARHGGQTLVLWDRSAVDWGPRGRASGISRRLHAAQDGDILLMHDGGRGINRPGELVKILPQFLAYLKRFGDSNLPSACPSSN